VSVVPFEAESWGTPIERERERIPVVPPDLERGRDRQVRGAGSDITVAHGTDPINGVAAVARRIRNRPASLR
jgi:hypothetical protein